jgi:myo-inositol-1(or 4)-monophosphatase
MDAMQDFLTTTLFEASKIAVTNFDKVSGMVKPDDNNQVLTSTDIAIGDYIVSRLQEEYPNYSIIDEEAGVIDNHSSYTWVVDPIDGTSNFTNGIQTYGIMIGLLKDALPIAGGIALPDFDEIYIAKKGKGTTCNTMQCHVSEEKTLLNALIAYGIDGHQEDPSKTIEETALLANIILGIRNLRSSNSTYDHALVAKGKYGACLNRTSKIWDNVAPQIIIEEAGGIYTDFFGNPMDYSNPLDKIASNFTWCAGSPTLHKQLQAIIHQTV